MSEIRGWASQAPDSRLEPYRYSPESLAPDEVEISVEYCGLCHSDLSMLRNDWGLTQYPIIPGHEVVGRIVDDIEYDFAFLHELHLDARLGVHFDSQIRGVSTV